MMKRCFYVLVAVACCACSKSVCVSSEVKEEVVELNFSVPVQATKVAGYVTEDAVETLQVFVFDENGQVQSSGMADGNSLTLTCTTGEKEIAAVVNSTPLEGISDLDKLKDRMSDFNDNSVERFVMSGTVSRNLIASGSVDIPVKRLVSKVTLSSVTRSFRLKQHQNMDFELQSVFLTNAPQQTGFFRSLQSDQLINNGETDMNAIIAAAGDLLYDDLEDVPVAQDEKAEIGNFLYCYPNIHADATTPAYLVLQTRLGSGIYYYTVALPVMESNKCYDVALTVTMPGSLTPDVPVKKEDAVFSVSVMDWSGKVDINETI